MANNSNILKEMEPLPTKTLKHAKTEVSLRILADNFIRMMNVIRVKGLITALKT